MTRRLFLCVLFACSSSHDRDAAVDSALDAGSDGSVDGDLDGQVDGDLDASDGSAWDAVVDGSGACELVSPGTWEQLTAFGMLGRRGVRGVVVLASGNVALMGSDVGGSGRVQIYHPADDSWTDYGTTLLYHNSATRLRSGRALAVGSGALWTWTEPRDRFVTQDAAITVDDDGINMTTAPTISRMVHGAVLLQDDRVMIAGGWHAEYSGAPGGDTEGRVLTEVEAYAEDTESWERLAPMNDARWAFSLTLLSDGRVLATGGFDSTHTPLASSEIYHPESNTWTRTGSMGSPRAWHEAQPLPSGRVLVMGGYSTREMFTASAEIFDPSTGIWTSAPGLPLPFANAASLALSSGRVVLAGGFSTDDGEFRVLDDAFLFDESERCWQTLPSMNIGRFHFGLGELADGAVFAGAARTVDGATDIAERVVIE